MSDAARARQPSTRAPIAGCVDRSGSTPRMGFVPAARLKCVKRPGRRAARAFRLIVVREIEVGAMAIIAHATAARVSMPSSPSRIVAAPMPENGCVLRHHALATKTYTSTRLDLNVRTVFRDAVVDVNRVGLFSR